MFYREVYLENMSNIIVVIVQHSNGQNRDRQPQSKQKHEMICFIIYKDKLRHVLRMNKYECDTQYMVSALKNQYRIQRQSVIHIHMLKCIHTCAFWPEIFNRK